MVIDTSVVLAVLQNEPEAHALIEIIDNAGSLSMSVASFIETSTVIEAHFGADGVRDFDLLLSKAAVDLMLCDSQQAQIARRAFREYGKGRRPAGLNFGDCFAYALAQSLGEPLLYKSNDFARTDVWQASTRLATRSPMPCSSGVSLALCRCADHNTLHRRPALTSLS